MTAEAATVTASPESRVLQARIAHPLGSSSALGQRNDRRAAVALGIYRANPKDNIILGDWERCALLRDGNEALPLRSARLSPDHLIPCGGSRRALPPERGVIGLVTDEDTDVRRRRRCER